MAGTQAIYGVSWALKTYIENAYANAMNQAIPTVSLKAPHEVSAGLTSQEGDGFTLCIYRISMQYSNPNLGNRKDGLRTYQPSLPLDLHFLMTPWAKGVANQHRMLGWLMRALEDMGPLPAEVINGWLPEPVFRADESVELRYEPLATADYFNLWDKFREKFPLSATYVARAVMLDSPVPIGDGKPVTTREFKLGRPPMPA